MALLAPFLLLGEASRNREWGHSTASVSTSGAEPRSDVTMSCAIMMLVLPCFTALSIGSLLDLDELICDEEYRV